MSGYPVDCPEGGIIPRKCLKGQLSYRVTGNYREHMEEIRGAEYVQRWCIEK